MPRPGKGGRYHHGDLRTALIDTAIELIGERGVRGFSLAEASRRLGVAVSAPYAHFADRDDLLAAVAVRAYEQLLAGIRPDIGELQDPRPAGRHRPGLRAVRRHHRPLFDMLYEAGIDKASHPEIEAAERPLTDAFLDCVRAMSGDASDEAVDDLATALEATAYGHAVLLLDSGSGQDSGTVELAAERTARATLALIESRRLLGAGPRPPGYIRQARQITKAATPSGDRTLTRVRGCLDVLRDHKSRAGGIRTHTARNLNPVPPADWATTPCGLQIYKGIRCPGLLSGAPRDRWP